MSLFITFEGGEGCGKSVQAKSLFRRLQQKGVPVLLTHEPGGTPAGERIARTLKWARNTDISPLTELMLFNASRSQLVTEVITPTLREGKVVICDRYADSTTAYQSYGRGLDLKLTKTINNAGTQGLKPDLTVLLDISPEDGLKRKRNRKQDRFEQEDLDFHIRVRQGYLALAATSPRRWLVIDATQSRARIARIVLRRVERLLSRKGA
jgi:dTMP kinase